MIVLLMVIGVVIGEFASVGLLMGITDIVMGAFDRPGFGFWACVWINLALGIYVALSQAAKKVFE